MDFNGEVRTEDGKWCYSQTQGKEERFHRTLRVEMLQNAYHRDAPALQQTFDDWRPVYNHKRPHEALGMRTPGTHYQPSGREFHPTPPAYRRSRG